MRYYDVTCNINGRLVTFPISEEELHKAYGEYTVDVVSDKIEAYLSKTHPDAKSLYGDDYRRTIRSLGYEMLDAIETEGMYVDEITEVHIESILREYLLPYRSFSTVMLPHGKVNLYAKYVVTGSDHLVATITKDAVTYSDEKEAQYLDVLREVSHAKALLH